MRNMHENLAQYDQLSPQEKQALRRVGHENVVVLQSSGEWREKKCYSFFDGNIYRVRKGCKIPTQKKTYYAEVYTNALGTCVYGSSAFGGMSISGARDRADFVGYEYEGHGVYADPILYKRSGRLFASIHMNELEAGEFLVVRPTRVLFYSEEQS